MALSLYDCSLYVRAAWPSATAKSVPPVYRGCRRPTFGREVHGTRRIGADLIERG